jgi:acetaldehyde dehydrogenase
MTSTPTAAIVGTGNIGTDLMVKLGRSSTLELRYVVGIDPDSEGMAKAKAAGYDASPTGVDWLLARKEPPDIVFEATSAAAHVANAPRYEAAGMQVVDLTPAALGPFVVPVVNVLENANAPNVNLITCGGQATIPIVSAVSSVTEVPYAEIVAAIASRSAGLGTRANIDEFTRTTARGIELVGGSARGKAVIVLNPAEPPLIMRDTVFCAVPPQTDRKSVLAAILSMVSRVQHYVPGYRLTADPQFDEPRAEWGGFGRVSVLIEVEGNGDYLPPYAGNLDIMTAAAAKVGEDLVMARRPTMVVAP